MGCFKEINLSSRLQKHKQTQTTDLWKLPASRLPGCCWGPPGGEGGCSRSILRTSGAPGPAQYWASPEIFQKFGGCAPQHLAIPLLTNSWPFHLLNLSRTHIHALQPLPSSPGWHSPGTFPHPIPSPLAAGMASEDIHWPSHWPFSVAPPLHLFRVPSFWPLLLFFLHLPPLGEGSYWL